MRHGIGEILRGRVVRFQIFETARVMRGTIGCIGVGVVGLEWF